MRWNPEIDYLTSYTVWRKHHVDPCGQSRVDWMATCLKVRWTMYCKYIYIYVCVCVPQCIHLWLFLGDTLGLAPSQHSSDNQNDTTCSGSGISNFTFTFYWYPGRRPHPRLPLCTWAMLVSASFAFLVPAYKARVNKPSTPHECLCYVWWKRVPRGMMPLGCLQKQLHSLKLTV